MSEAQRQAEACFQDLETLYTQLDHALMSEPSSAKAKGNPCGRCRECCTGKGLTAHNVTRLELNYIANRVGPERLETFARFLTRDGEIEVCPYFDDEAWGCGIYAHRPYSCRVFGHHRSDATVLPAVCVFAGQEKVFAQAEYYQAVPLAGELRDLVRRYWPFGPEHFDEAAPDPSDGFSPVRTAGDALDRALVLMSQERLQEALEEFEASDLPSTPYVLYCLSLVFEGLERHADACTALTVALEDAPECVPLWFRLACNRYSQGLAEPSEQAFLKTLELNPAHALAHGLLGGHYLEAGRKAEAVEHLRKATQLAPELESFPRLLEQAKAIPNGV